MEGLAELRSDLDRLSRDGFCADIVKIARESLTLLTPPERISTTECATRFRKLPAPEGKGTIDWSPTLTPYINDIQDLLDDPRVEMVVVIKPGRVGGTVAAENYLFKLMKFGPLVDVLWYLGAGSEVDAYVDNVVTPMFEIHPDLKAKIGKGRSDNKLAFKRINGRRLAYLPVNPSTITNRQAGFIVVDEIDTVRPRLRGTMANQVKIRGRTLGSRRKAYICSHPDAGWNSGVGAAYKETCRSIWWWECPECRWWSSPAPPAKHRMVLHYDRLEGVTDDEYLDRVKGSARLLCPHCGSLLDDTAKAHLLANRKLVFEGQTIDAETGDVTGEPRSMTAVGLWIHGTMTPFVKLGELARSYETAKLHFQRTRKPEKLREVTSKEMGEIYEGGGAGGADIAPERLAERAGDAEGFAVGTVPDGVLFVTASVDPGGAKFDVGFWGWDLEGRSWLIDRMTLKQRRWPDGRLRDIRPAERIDDWNLIRTEVLNRKLPLASDPDMALPVAAVAIDSGDGNVTWKAREFARRMAVAGYAWGKGASRWERVRLIKGAKSPAATELPTSGRRVSVDEEGRPVAPTVMEFDLGVYKLKSQAVERLAVADGGPGQCYFADGLPRSTFAEFTGEVLIDGTWERRGPNETLDLFGYAEAVRLMLRPDRADIKWNTLRPIWARPVRISGDEPAATNATTEPATSAPRSARQRLAELNRKR
jgi:phage terminase large subunit GpA-like protein